MQRFGASFRVLKVSAVTKVSSSRTQLTCRARVLLNNGDQSRLTIKVKGSGSSSSGRGNTTTATTVPQTDKRGDGAATMDYLKD